MAWFCCRSSTDTCVNTGENVHTTVCTGCGHERCDACETVVDNDKEEEANEDLISEMEFSDGGENLNPEIESSDDGSAGGVELPGSEYFIDDLEDDSELPEVDVVFDKTAEESDDSGEEETSSHGLGRS